MSFVFLFLEATGDSSLSSSSSLFSLLVMGHTEGDAGNGDADTKDDKV